MLIWNPSYGCISQKYTSGFRFSDENKNGKKGVRICKEVVYQKKPASPRFHWKTNGKWVYIDCTVARLAWEAIE